MSGDEWGLEMGEGVCVVGRFGRDWWVVMILMRVVMMVVRGGGEGRVVSAIDCGSWWMVGGRWGCGMGLDGIGVVGDYECMMMMIMR